FASTPRASASTSGTAASCSSCCGDYWARSARSSRSFRSWRRCGRRADGAYAHATPLLPDRAAPQPASSSPSSSPGSSPRSMGSHSRRHVREQRPRRHDWSRRCGSQDGQFEHATHNRLVENRWRRLIETGIAVTSELSLDAVLQRIVEAAAQLTGAKYAALGVSDRSGQGLERFLTTGIDAETHERIGELPHGRGILGVLIRDSQTLRLRDLTTDPRSVGFPPHHPPMRTFLGVPILLRGVAYGNLYLTEKQGGEDFTAEDEELVTLLAAQAAVAIENARLYESATRWLAQLESLTEVGNALAGETELGALLELIATRLGELIGAELVVTAVPVGGDDDLRIEAAAGPRAAGLVGTMLSRTTSKSGRVLDRRRSERVDSTFEDVEIDQDVARRVGLRSGLFVPMIVGDRAIGVIAAHNKLGSDPRFTDEDLRLAETFAARAAVAVDLADRVARDSLRRVVEGQELERARLARELHDETGQALTSILLGLKQVEDAKSEQAARHAAAVLRAQIVDTL